LIKQDEKDTDLYKISPTSAKSLVLAVKDCSSDDKAQVVIEEDTDRDCQFWRIYVA
jgi:hypothetical protein